jgi:hypothetical protein
MKIPKNWIAALGVALSLPSTILGIAWGAFKLVELGYISRFWAIILFVTVVGNSLALLVWHGINKKN